MTNVVKLERDWYDLLHRGRDGPRPVLGNVLTALRKAPEMEGRLGFDEFAQRTVCDGIMPWTNEDHICEVWTDTHDILCTEWMNKIGLFVDTGVVTKAVEAVAREQTFHPVRDYLEDISAWMQSRRRHGFGRSARHQEIHRHQGAGW